MSTTETATTHKHRFPCNPPGGTFLNPGPCECKKTYSQDEADRFLAEGIVALLDAYGDAARVSTHWAVGYGPDGAYVELYDDEEDAREHVQFYEGGFVARRTVVSLPWETVPAGEPSP